MGKNMNLKDWHYYRENWKPRRLRNRGPPKIPILDLDKALDRLGQLRSGSCSHLLMYADLIRQCGNQGALYHGRRVHAHILDHGFGNNAFLGELIFQMYARCRCLDTALALFNAMPAKRVQAWNTLIRSYNETGMPDEALRIYKRMSAENVQPDESSFCLALVSCGYLGDLNEGRAVHYRVTTGYRVSPIVQSAIITMYSKCRRTDLAKSAFDTVHENGLVAWNAMISAYTQNGHFTNAVSLYVEMIRTDAAEPDDITYASALAACAGAGDLRQGVAIHMRVRADEYIGYVKVQNALVSMYSKCGRIEEARQVFEEMPKRNVVSWTSMISAYAQLGHSRMAIDMYERMDSEGIEPDERTFSSVVAAVASLGTSGIEHGRRIHARAVACGLESDGILQNSLVNMYAKCGSIEEAKKVFEQMKSKGVVAYTSMISGYVHNGHSREALRLFRCMLDESVKPNEITFASAFAACIATGDLTEGSWIHRQMVETGFRSDDPFAHNSLMDMYAKCGDLSLAVDVFEKMKNKDLIAWTTIISANVQFGNYRQALELYKRMLDTRIRPDVVILSTLITACAGLGSLTDGQHIHHDMIEAGLGNDTSLQNALVSMYAKCGSLHLARCMFDNVKYRDVVTWTSMLAAYAQEGHSSSTVLELFRLMQADGVTPNSISFIPVLIACSQAGLVEEGRTVFTSLTDDYYGELSSEHYGCMVDVLGRAGKLKEAEELIDSMPYMPDTIVWQSLLASSRVHNNALVGTRAADCLLLLDPETTSPYLLLSEIYSAVGRNSDVEVIKEELRARRINKMAQFCRT